jgi:hypothetical protein
MVTILFLKVGDEDESAETPPQRQRYDFQDWRNEGKKAVGVLQMGH